MSLQRFTAFLAIFIISAGALFSDENASSSGIFVEDKSVQQEFEFDEAYSTYPELLKSDRKSAIEKEKTKITVKSNVPNAEVFLNGNFEGHTNLTVNDLPAGRYNLRVKKIGYKPKFYRINVPQGEERVFYVELEKYEGTVNFIAVQPETLIYVDNTKISGNIVQLEEGSHTVFAKKFGYKSESSSIYVPRNSYQIITIRLQEAQFSVSNFRANKEHFNPALKGSAGQIKFNFEVTSFGNGTLTIKDSLGNSVISRNLPGFTTWTQNVIWDGIAQNGTKIQDGTYTAILESGEQKFSVDFSADSSIKIPSASITASGSGIGILPAAFNFPEKTFCVGVNAGIICAFENKNFYCAPLSTFFAYSFSKNVELSAKVGLNAGHEGSSPFINSALKFTASKKQTDFDMDFGFLIRAGGAKNKPFEPYGADNGCGLGGGLVFGLDFNNFYAGISSEFTFATSTFNTKNDNYDKVLRNGICFQLKGQSVSFAIFSALNSSFGTTALENDGRSSNSIEFLRAVDVGFDFQIALNSLNLNLRSNAQFFENQTYLKTEAGISMLL